MDIEQYSHTSFVLDVMLKLFLVHHMARNFEFFALAKQFSKNGVLSWEIIRLRNQNRITRIIQRPALIYSNVIFIIIMLISTASALLLITGITSVSAWMLFIPVLICSFLLHFRNNLFCDGSDTMSNLLCICLMISLCNIHSQVIITATIIFIAIQTMFSYFFAGISKLKSSAWMNGTALYGVLNTEVFGNASAADVVKKLNPHLNKLANKMVAIWQCTFPLSLLLPKPLFFIFIASGLLFHFVNIFAMRIPRFFLIYLSVYPSLIFVKLKYLDY